MLRLARRAGFDPSHLSRLERGMHEINTSQIERIRAALEAEGGTPITIGELTRAFLAVRQEYLASLAGGVDPNGELSREAA